MAILGIDEVGRGPWAGPLVIGAVILPKDEAGNYPSWVDPLTDSKKLSLKKREEFSKIILDKALATGLGWVTSKEIDELGLSEALSLATHRAVEEIRKRKVPFSEIIIDGTINFLKDTSLENHVTVLKKAVFLIKEFSAASIIAKVARDDYMKKLAEKFPEYGFDKHVGYGTKLHSDMLKQYGPCPEHRFSFAPVRAVDRKTFRRGERCSSSGSFPPATTATYIPDGADRSAQRAVLPDAQRMTSQTESGDPDKSARPQTLKVVKFTTKQLGDKAENLVADYLIKNNHTIVARNHKTKFYEIDIISTKDDKIYFTEVKYRKNQYRGTPLDMITKEKLKQMTFSAEAFLKYYKELKETYSPLLSVGLVSGDDFKLEDWFVISES